MKIGIEAQRIFRTKKHGMDIVTLELIRALQKIDTENEYVIFVRPDVDRDVISETANFRIVEVPSISYALWEQVALPRAVARERVDLLHCTSNTAPISVGVPLIITLHDIIFLEKLNLSEGTLYQRLGTLYRRSVVPHVVDKCSRIITVSGYEQGVISSYFSSMPPEKICAVYNGVSDHFRKRPAEEEVIRIREKYNLPHEFILFLGNTHPKKNVPNVLRGLKILFEEGKLNFKLVMPDFTPANLQKVLNQVGAPELREYIHLPGYVSNRDLPVLYNQSTLFLYPSLRESFGIPILEAMCCETPVITSDTSSMPEVAGDAALLVDPRDPCEIAAGIYVLMTNPARRREMVRRGLEVCESFTWEKTAREVLKIYEEVDASPDALVVGGTPRFTNYSLTQAV